MNALTRALPWLGGIAAVLILPHVFSSGASISIMSLIGFGIIFALSYNILLGQTGMLSFGHAVYYGLGGFITAHALNIIAGSKLPIPLPIAMASAVPMVKMEMKIHGVTPESAKADLKALPGLVDHVDALIAAGVIGGESVNAADLQILSSIRLLDAIGDFKPLLAGRPCHAAAFRVFPGAAGDVPAGVLPADELALLS